MHSPTVENGPVSLRNHFLSTRYQLWTFFLLLALLFLYLLSIPLKGHLSCYEIYHYAVSCFWEGRDPYLHVSPGANYFKYGPSFLLFPMSFLYPLPAWLGASLWQLFSALIYCWGWVVFMKAITVQAPRFSRLTFPIFLLISFLDLSANGIYLQANSLMVGAMLLGLGYHLRGHYLPSALALAFAGHLKIVPIALALMLFLHLQWRFIFYYILCHLFFIALPLVTWSLYHSVSALDLLNSWVQVLAMDGELIYGRWAPQYLSLKAFLEVNFGLVFHRFLLLISLVLGAGMALLWFWRHRVPNPRSLQLLTLVLFTYILLFNPRSEGPSTVMMGPLYSILFLNLMRRPAWLPGLFLFLLFFTLSLSASDLTKGTALAKLFWDHNLRTVGILALFMWSGWALFSDRAAEKLLGPSVAHPEGK